MAGRPVTGRPPLRRLLPWVVAPLLGSTALAALAGCLLNEQVGARATVLARQAFPLVATRMPRVWTCSRDVFPPAVSGQYRSGSHEILAPDWLPWGPEFDMVLLHELGHAQAWLAGGDPGSDGHGPAWVQAMVDAGLEHEARRMATYSADAASALTTIAMQRHQVAIGEPNRVAGPSYGPLTQVISPPPPPPRQVCYRVPQQHVVGRSPWGQVMLQTQWLTVCQWM